MQMDAGNGGLESDVRKVFECVAGFEELSRGEARGNGGPD
jgi:hypothetical protein